MRQYDLDQLVDRKGTFSSKWEFMPGDDQSALPLWVADMDFPCADPIIDALHKRIDRKIFGYTVYNNPTYKEAVIGWYKRRHGWDVKAEDIFFSPGVVPAICYLIQALSEEGDGIVIQRPVYYPFTNSILGNGRKVVNNPLIYQDGRYTMDYEDLDKKMADPGVKGMILCSPHNPVGRVWTLDELKKVVEIAKKYDKWIISDEIHFDLVREGVTHIPLLKACPEYKDRIIVCTAPSKTFNLAGIQGSNILIANEEVRKKFQAQVAKAHASANIFAGPATIAAYNEGEQWLDELIDVLRGNCQYFVDFIHEHCPELKVRMNEATYLMWLDCRGLGMTEEELGKWFAEKVGIAANVGSWFGQTGTCFRRLNMACPRTFVEDACQRIEKAVKELRK